MKGAGRYGVVPDHSGIGEGETQRPAAATGASAMVDQTALLRELRGIREEQAKQLKHTDKQFDQVRHAIANLSDRVVTHEREIAVISATKKAEEKSADDTGRFHMRTIDRIHGRIDGVTNECASIREAIASLIKDQGETRDRIWKLALATTVGGGASGGVAAAVWEAVTK